MYKNPQKYSEVNDNKNKMASAWEERDNISNNKAYIKITTSESYFKIIADIKLRLTREAVKMKNSKNCQNDSKHSEKDAVSLANQNSWNKKGGDTR